MLDQCEYLPEEVSSAIRAFVSANYGESVSHIEVVRSESRNYSTISVLAARTRSGISRFVMKHVISNPMNADSVAERDQAQVEYEVLARLYSQFEADSDCRVSRPVAVFPDRNLLLTEFSSGHVLAEDLRYLHYWEKSGQHLEMACNFHRCGIWLKKLLSVTGTRWAGTEALDPLIRHCKKRLRVIQEAAKGRCARGLEGAVGITLEGWKRQLGDSRIPVSGQHSDYGPWNIIASDGAITVIDFYGFGDAPVPVSILSILVFLESARHGLANSTARIHHLRKEFLTGLGPLPEAAQPLVLLCEAYQRIISAAAAVIGRGGHLFHRWERFASLKANLLWLREPPSKSLLWIDQGQRSTTK